MLRSAQALDYHPDSIAKSLRVKHTFSLGLIVRDIENPNFAMMCAAVTSEAAGHGYTVFMCSSSWNVDAERQVFRAMIERRFDGVVLLLADEARAIFACCSTSGSPSCSSRARRGNPAERSTACSATTSAARARPGAT